MIKERVSRETLDRANLLYRENESALTHYLELLLWWNQRQNLVSRAVSRETVRQHVVHSLMPAAAEWTHFSTVWVDAGSGGGLPGIPLAIVNPERRWVLNDRSEKKMMAVRHMVRELALQNVDVQTGSIGEIEWKDEYEGVISKHAFPVDRLLEQIKNRPWKHLVMFKGVDEPDVVAMEDKMMGFDQSGSRMVEFVYPDHPFYEGKGMLHLLRSTEAGD